MNESMNETKVENTIESFFKSILLFVKLYNCPQTHFTFRLKSLKRRDTKNGQLGNLLQDRKAVDLLKRCEKQIKFELSNKKSIGC
jgi:hypothetical protein